MNSIGILLVFCSIGHIYADHFFAAREGNGPSNNVDKVENRVLNDVNATPHSMETLNVNTDDTSIVSNYDNVDFTRIIARKYNKKDNLANSGLEITEPSDPYDLPDHMDCAIVISIFFSNCRDCQTYLDYAKYMLLYVVYREQYMTCIRGYMNYVEKAMKKKKGGFMTNDRYSVTSPLKFCRRLDSQWFGKKREACIKQMHDYFGSGLSLYSRRRAIAKIFYYFDLIHIQKQQNSGYIQGYIRHVKNRFYYDKKKLYEGEEITEYCLNVYKSNYESEPLQSPQRN